MLQVEQTEISPLTQEPWNALMTQKCHCGVQVQYLDGLHTEVFVMLLVPVGSRNSFFRLFQEKLCQPSLGPL